jgi:hypothetical protein
VAVVVAGVTVTEAVAELPLSDVVTVAVWLDFTVPAVAVKLAEVAPAGTVTEAGTDRAELLDESVTVAPPAGAACDSVTAQVEVPPEVTVVGVHCAASVVDPGATATDAVVELPLSDAVTVTV